MFCKLFLTLFKKNTRIRVLNQFSRKCCKFCKIGFVGICSGVLNRLLKIEEKLRRLSQFTIVKYFGILSIVFHAHIIVVTICIREFYIFSFVKFHG